MTGADLYVQLSEWLKANPQYAVARVSLAVQGTRHLGAMRKTKCCKIETVRKALAVMREPSDDLLKYAVGPKRHKALSGGTFSQRIRRGNRKKALERIEAGLPVGGPGSSAGITCAQRSLASMIEYQRRANDPLEQALIALRRERLIVFRASVTGGRHDHFIIHRRSGDQTIPASEIMRMAERLGA